MGFFENEEEPKRSEGFEYIFGESVAPVLERWSKLLIEMQNRITSLEKENRNLWDALNKKQDFDVMKMRFSV